jgi:hypothetical protein
MANAVAEVLKTRNPTNSSSLSFTFFAPPELSRLDKLVAQNVSRSGQDYLKGRVEGMKRSVHHCIHQSINPYVEECRE